MGNINVCKSFGYDFDESMKLFSIVEMFIGIFHMIIAAEAFLDFDQLSPVVQRELPSYATDEQKAIKALETFIWLLYILLFLLLISQAIFGLLLYFIGYKKRNITICWIWIIISCVTFSTPGFILLFDELIIMKRPSYQSRPQRHPYWHVHYLYLVHFIIGVWIVISFINWAKKAGVAVRFAVTPTATPSATATPVEPIHSRTSATDAEKSRHGSESEI